MDEPSSIIIDTKVTVGNPICSKEQKEQFMKNSLGQEDPDEEDGAQEDSDDNENDSDEDRVEKKKKKATKAPAQGPDKLNLQKTLNMQSLITKQIFDYVAGGNV